MQANKASAAQPRLALLWRIHLWAALIASPFILVATLTGILYIFTPQIEAALYARLDRVEPSGAVRPLDAAIAAASAAVPHGWRVQTVFPAHALGATTRVVFVQGSGGHDGHHAAPVQGPARPLTVFVNPYTAQVLGAQSSGERFADWSRDLHSQLLQGDGWRWMIELAASAMMVMLVTGVAAWWTSRKKRSGWRRWHAAIGVAASILTLTILVTGLTWSKYAGSQILRARDAVGQASPKPPAGLMSHTSAALTWQAALDAARASAPDVPVQITTPNHGIWRAGAADPGQPFKRFDLLLDENGQPLYYSGWDQLTAFGKATAVGIPFHRGEFGWWNQALLLVFAAGVLFSLVSGWVMYFKRRRPALLALPEVKAAALKSAGPSWWLTAVALAVLMPVGAVAAGVVLLLEGALYARHAA